MSATLWKIAGKVHDFSTGGWIMGVLNVTPDSFSDGGRFLDRDRAIERGEEMIRQGADILDIGGESTRPGARPISAQEEKQRVLPVLETLARQSSCLISVDTSKAEVAEAAVQAGAKIVNDVTGGRGDKSMWPLVARSEVGFVIMHMQGTPRTMQEAPRYSDVVAEVVEFFRQQYSCAVQSGIDPMRLAFDPGIGFGKTLEHNLALLKNLSRLRIARQPLVVGVSRKGFLGKISGRNGAAAERLVPTVAFTSLLRMIGADVLRVHDVRANLEALRVADALRNTP